METLDDAIRKSEEQVKSYNSGLMRAVEITKKVTIIGSSWSASNELVTLQHEIATAIEQEIRGE